MLEQEHLVPEGLPNALGLPGEELGPRGGVVDELHPAGQPGRLADGGGPELLLGHRGTVGRLMGLRPRRACPRRHVSGHVPCLAHMPLLGNRLPVMY